MDYTFTKDKEIVFSRDSKHLIVSSPKKMDYYIVVLGIKGSMKLRVGYHSFVIDAGTISIISPDVIYSTKSVSEDFEVMQIFFHKSFLYKLFLKENIIDELLYLNADYPPLYRLEDRYNEVHSLFSSIEIELQEKYAYHLDMIRLKVIALLYEYNRACEYCLLGFRKNMNRQYQLTYQFKQLVDEKYKDLKSVQEYASLLGITAKHLTEVIKEEIGDTALHLIHERIILEAQYLLKHSGFSIKECAYELGYNDVSYFSRFFKTYVGVTPSQFKCKSI
ncbi:helix-turn-helix domain-containing protein [Myroides sp. BIT-d1]|uniref:Helix-turn-helix domain-containing protein n=3 Tax=Flavobacteriaceae TaxID=49546 RepID=A0A6I3LL31_9FLAO|nr:helix-turn-helix domain-containing protein [Myroides albus]MVX36996.1 helix-turn-helix domain-containing protein [Myroides sp. LoEW2-1]